jgi:two-component system, NtrC family, nitrogen regulation response regulator NtrX
MPSVLIVDDEPNLRRMVGALLAGEGYEVREAGDGQSGLTAARDFDPDVVLLDLMMPGALDGLATLERLRGDTPDLPVVMMSGRAGLADAVRAAKLGAVSFLEKPLAQETVLVTVQSAVELRQARRETRVLRAEVGLAQDLVGDSSAMRRVREEIARVAPTDARVMITGESGTGKELAAVALHAAGPRRAKPLIRVNCAAIPRDLVESEMFGHEKGSFTGATDRRIGKFELAHGGTLFLDEVGDLGLEAQAKLLRAIEAREIERVGGAKPIPVDVRIISATNKDLAAAVHAGAFREDLFFRLNVIPLFMPPLRDRHEDMADLVAHHGERYRQRTGRAAPHFTPPALATMAAHAWPGNVRELANIVERLAIVHGDAAIQAADVQAVLAPSHRGRPVTPAAGQDALPEVPLSDALDAYEKRLITHALAAADGNVAEAARRLQTDRPNLYRRMRRLGLHANGAE